jgi:hypothetical protein
VNRYDDPPHAQRPQAPDSAALSDIRQSAGRLARNDETLARQLHEEMVRLVPGSALPLAFDMEAFCRRLIARESSRHPGTDWHNLSWAETRPWPPTWPTSGSRLASSSPQKGIRRPQETRPAPITA